jgi:hypothetical protein
MKTLLKTVAVTAVILSTTTVQARFIQGVVTVLTPSQIAKADAKLALRRADAAERKQARADALAKIRNGQRKTYSQAEIDAAPNAVRQVEMYEQNHQSAALIKSDRREELKALEELKTKEEREQIAVKQHNRWAARLIENQRMDELKALKDEKEAQKKLAKYKLRRG